MPQFIRRERLTAYKITRATQVRDELRGQDVFRLTLQCDVGTSAHDVTIAWLADKVGSRAGLADMVYGFLCFGADAESYWMTAADFAKQWEPAPPEAKTCKREVNE